MSLLPSLGPRGEGWFALQVVLLAAVAVTGFLLGPDLADMPRLVAGVIGVALLALGIVVGFVGIRHLDRALTPLPRPIETGTMVEHGIYRHLRHPIYLGVFASALGWALLMASAISVVLALALGMLLDLKARREELWLRERYPAYARYAARTRKFVPRVY
ncbi:isoprenylcysteine carboxylmethyltransferase family protein [soil metagenome]